MTDVDAGRAKYLEKRLLFAVRVVLLGVPLVIQFGVYGLHFLVTQPVYGVELAMYLVLAVIGVSVAAISLARGRVPAVARVVGAVALLVCSVVLSAVLSLDPVPRAEHWSFSLIGWYALALLFDTRLFWFALFVVAHTTISVLPLVINGITVEDFSAVAVIVVAVSGFQVGVAMSALAVRRISASAAQRSLRLEAAAVAEEAAAAAARNRAWRYADLQTTTIPLLEGFARNELDPRDPGVRHRCAVEAARMRRLFGENDKVDDRLVHDLGAIIDVAERLGASVHLSVRGTPLTVPERVRHQLVAPVSEAVVSARSAVRLTVMYTPDRVRIGVRCAATDPSPAPGADVEVTRSVRDGQLWLEVSWRSR
ncbi:hypothetical protein [Amycolatopsis suaedae]|uniref:Histidine kinase n=1 Tax=Amycolatopsis suaedae TaxID=2510978 RepID=A0A4Q7JCF6_9PSEU|nr:hypothetical protein [Amycolatopsis suaedae]RZQ64818.1 hypothetical protein EWH70_08005 [Amycolatopsis suaedae]